MAAHVRTTLNIDADLLRKAREFSGIRGTSAVVNAGLQALVHREALRQLAALGGTIPGARAAPRRRFGPPKGKRV